MLCFAGRGVRAFSWSLFARPFHLLFLPLRFGKRTGGRGYRRDVVFRGEREFTVETYLLD